MLGVEEWLRQLHEMAYIEARSQPNENWCSLLKGFPMPRLTLSVLTLLLVSTLATLVACNTAQQQASQSAAPPDTRAADESAIRALDAEWVKAAIARDVEKTASYYAERATLLAPNAPISTGKDSVQKAFAGLMAMPGFTLTFAPAKVEVSRSGDLAYEIGDYEITANDKKGKPQTTKAVYVVVWGKQADGTWKALVDAPTTTVR